MSFYLTIRWLLATLITSCVVTLPAMAQDRPVRGKLGGAVYLCYYSGEDMPDKTPEYISDKFKTPGTGGAQDYFSDISNGLLDLSGLQIFGWYQLDKTLAETRAYGGGGDEDREQKLQDCLDKALAEGAPERDYKIVVTDPSHDAFGSPGQLFMGVDDDLGTFLHEFAHTLRLNHSHSDDPGACLIEWASVGEYDNAWDLMSYGSGFAPRHPQWGRTGPRLNAYHLDRLGWVPINKIYAFGAEGEREKTVTLTSLSRPNGAGYHMVRIPFDVNDPNQYFTIEYRQKETWDRDMPRHTVLIHEVKFVDRFPKCGGRPPSENGGYRSYLLRGQDGARNPIQSVTRHGVSIELVQIDSVVGTAKVRVRSERPTYCMPGFVWRQATGDDRVCVRPDRRRDVAQETADAPSHTRSNGFCEDGYVWREAVAADRVCVRPNRRRIAKDENTLAKSRRLGGAALGPNTCKDGYVWRMADANDYVCTTPERRKSVAWENRNAFTRRDPQGQFGADTCREGYVWRNAYPADRVCVDAASRTEAQQENSMVRERQRNPDS